MDLPAPKDLSHHYSVVIRRSQQSTLKQFYPYLFIPGIGNLAGGLPDPKFFPYDNFEARVATPDRFEPFQTESSDAASSISTRNKSSKRANYSHILIPHYSPETDVNQKIDIASALQYGVSRGYAPLRQWMNEFATTKLTPNALYRGGFDTIMSLGNTDGFAKALHAFNDIWDERKDWIGDREGLLCEEFAFTPPIDYARSRGMNIAPVAIDEQGMLAEGPGGLRDVLANWDTRKGKRPHLMYTVTVGQNPTSGVLSLERKKQIYSLCSKYDVLIIEDDPYWFLQYPSANELSIKYRGKSLPISGKLLRTENKKQSSGSSFLDSLAPSYLAVDTDGRVLRLDTFSKSIAPGCRLGWITAQPALVSAIESFADLATQQPSGFTQAMVAELLLGSIPSSSSNGKGVAPTKDNELGSWQLEGWIRWLEGLRGNYERRMRIMAEILEIGKYKIAAQAEQALDAEDFEIVSKTQIFDFTFPMGGMFLWLRVCFENHPLFDHTEVSHADLSKAFWLFTITAKYRVLILPGDIFGSSPKVRAEKGWQYFRLCFAAVEDDILSVKTSVLLQAINDFFDIVDAQTIRDLIDNDPGKNNLTMAIIQAEMEGISKTNLAVY